VPIARPDPSRFSPRICSGLPGSIAS
jgi:hypothetical protein